MSDSSGRFTCLWYAGMSTTLACACMAGCVASGTQPNAVLRVTVPPDDVVKSFKLDPFYRKYVSAGGIPVVSSAKVSDYALLEAAYLINRMLDGRKDICKALVANKIRFAVMGVDEFTTDVPEHGHLKPKGFWDMRARGLESLPNRLATSCGEENLLCYRGDPYDGENICIHEFAHTIHLVGLNDIDKTFDKRLRKVYDKAMDKGLWGGKYAAKNRTEYFAEAVQSWFDTNREHDSSHNHVDTREELKKYDPDLAKLVAEVFGDKPWRYVRPSDRKDAAHLKGFDRTKAPRFTWPRRVRRAWREYQLSGDIVEE